MVIENKELGIKIAENTDEAFWESTKTKIEESIKADERNRKINEVILKLCEKEVKKVDKKPPIGVG